MLKKLSLFLVSVFAIMTLAACSEEKANGKEDGEGKVQVVATYSIVYDIVKNVGGDLVEIHSLAPIGSNPHEYDPLPVDVQKQPMQMRCFITD